jgi:flagellar assembly factor FliW
MDGRFARQPMIVHTSRFGQVQVTDDRLINFPKGLLGFPGQQRYVLIQPNDEGYFFWLQAVDTPDLAFVVTDPTLFVPEYTVPIRPEQMAELGLHGMDDAQVLVIVNKRGNTLTGNLQGPLVIHSTRRVGEQLVLADRRFHTRMPLVDLGSPMRAVGA